MAKAKSTAAPAAQTVEEVETLISRMGVLSRQLARQEADLGDKIAKAKEDAGALAKPLQDEFEEAQARVQGYCEANRAALTGGKTKTVIFASGVVSWRHRPPSVRISGKVEDLIAWMKANLGRRAKPYIRVKEELDREALRDAPAKFVTLLPGVRVGSAGEDFIIEPHAAELVERAA